MIRTMSRVKRTTRRVSNTARWRLIQLRLCCLFDDDALYFALTAIPKLLKNDITTPAPSFEAVRHTHLLTDIWGWKQLAGIKDLQLPPLIESPPKNRSPVAYLIKHGLQVLDREYRRQDPKLKNPGSYSANHYIWARIFSIINTFVVFKGPVYDTRLNVMKGLEGQSRSGKYYLFSCAPFVVTKLNAQGRRRDYLIVQPTDELSMFYKEQEEDPRLLCYMALVHKELNQRGEKDTIVYGLYTNSYDFVFIKIDNQSKVHVFMSGRSNPWEDVIAYMHNIFTPADARCDAPAEGKPTKQMYDQGIDFEALCNMLGMKRKQNPKQLLGAED